MKKYIIRYNSKNCVELSKPINTTLVYRIPYLNIKNKNHDIDISNRFIVYILYGKNEKGKDFLYVGKSKNGIDSRPTAHEDKNIKWNMCYILTDIKERTILNDGTIQYLEDKICNKVNEIDKYNNTTKQTTSGTANHSDMEDCDVFLEEAYDMLFTLGLDLFESEEDYNVVNVSQRNFEVADNLKSLFDRVDKLILSQDSGIIKEQMAVYYKYLLNDKVICTVGSSNTKLNMCFNIPYGKMVDSNNLLVDMYNKGHHGVGPYMLKFSSDNCFEDIKDFLKQTLNHYK